MRLTRLVLDDFGPYQHTDIDFGSVRDVVIRGRNGHGKSVLLDALTWALYDRHRYGTRQDRLVRDGTGLARVRVEFTANGRQIAVVRQKPLSRTGTLSLYIDGAEYKEHTQDETFAKLQSLIGLSWEALAAGPLLVQANQYPGNVVSLATAGPAGRADLLMEIADLGVYAAAYDEAVDRGKATAARKDALTEQRDRLMVQIEGKAEAAAAVDRARRAREQAERRYNAAAEKVAAAEKAAVRFEAVAAERDRIHAHVVTLSQAAQQHAERIRSLNKSLDEARADAGKPLDVDAPPEAPSADEVAALQKQIDEAGEAADAIREAERIVSESQAAISRIEQWQERVEQAPCGGKGKYAACPFLRRPDEFERLDEFRAAYAAAALVPTEKQPVADGARALVEQMQTLTDRRTAAERHAQKVEVARAAHDERIAAARQRVESLTAMLDEATQAKARDDAALAAALAEKSDIDARLTGLDAAEQAVEQAKIEHRAAEEAYRATERPLTLAEAEVIAIDRAEEELARIDGEVKQVLATYDTLRTLATAFKRTGIPTLIIENGVIPAVEQQANALLTQLPDAMRLALITQVERKGGKVTDTLDIAVEWKGRERDFEGLSIGQRFRVDLALRVAQSKVLTQRTGRTIDMLWLDEPVANADSVSALASAEALASMADQFGLLVVVSHHEQFIERFSNVLDVVQDDAGVATATLR